MLYVLSLICNKLLMLRKQKKAKAAQDAACKKVNNLIANNCMKRMEMLDNESRLVSQSCYLCSFTLTYSVVFCAVRGDLVAICLIFLKHM